MPRKKPGACAVNVRLLGTTILVDRRSIPSAMPFGQADSAATIFNGPDLGFPGTTDVFSNWDPSLVNMVPGLSVLRTGDNPFPGGYNSGVGYNVITWDPRGEYASGGVMQLATPTSKAATCPR